MNNTFRLILGAAALFAAAPLSAFPLGDEPVAVPRTIKQGIDFVYVDPQLNAVAKRHQRPVNWLLRTIGLDWAFGGSRDEPNPIFVSLAQGLQKYEATWGRLPQVNIPSGAMLRTRTPFGVTSFDRALL